MILLCALLLAGLPGMIPVAPASAAEDEAAAAPAEEAPADGAAAEESGAADEGGGDEAAADEGDGAGTVELMGEGDGDEEPAEEPEPAPEPAPAPAPKPAPKPKPKPKPKPAPKPAAPPSPFDYQMIEDFEKAEPGREFGTMRRAGTEPKPQFSARAVAGGAGESAKALTLAGVPPQADATAWFLTLPRALDLRGWRGISLRVKASKPTTELRLGVVGGGTIFSSAVIGLDWTEVHLDFRLDPGRGRFDPAGVTEIAVSCAHELAEAVDVTVDSIAAWRDREPKGGPDRIGMNLPPWPGPYEWRAVTESVNCAARTSAADGLALRCWSAPLPYQHWPNVLIFHELPRGLAGGVALVATVRAEPAQPETLLKFSLIEEGGERYSTVRSAGAGPLRIPFAEFVLDTIGMLRAGIATADGLLDPAAVTGWTLEVLPSTERQVQGTIYLKELYAEGAVAPAPKPSRVRRPKPKPEPKPEPAPEPGPSAEATAPEEAGAEDAASEAPADAPAGDEAPASEEPAEDLELN